MLRRTALVLLGLLVTATVGIFAADRLGVALPWTIASTQAPEQSSADAESPLSTDDAPGKASASAESAIEETVAALAGESTTETDPTQGDVALDISRISPDGPSVFAGRAAPGAYITVYADGKSAGTVQADDGGSWSLSTEHKFASADPNITFESAPVPPATSPEPAPPPEAAATAEPAATEEPAVAQERTETAAAEDAPATEQVTEDAPAAAGDVMRKFEELVSEAREDAAREKAAEDDAAREKEEQRRQQARAQTQAALKAQRDAEQAAAEAARKEAEKKEADRETVVAAATATPAPSTLPAASDKAEEAVEKPAASSDASASASADAVPGTKSTVDGDAAGKGTETKAAMLAATDKAARPEAQAPIPVPIMFVYNQATLTSEGERAAELLLEYLLLKRLDSVELTGHADERGTHNYNFDLSRERLEAVSRILTNGGYKGELKLTPKGKTEPFKGIDRKKYRGEALYQFDRRVELRVTR